MVEAEPQNVIQIIHEGSDEGSRASTAETPYQPNNSPIMPGQSWQGTMLESNQLGIEEVRLACCLHFEYFKSVYSVTLVKILTTS